MATHTTTPTTQPATIPATLEEASSPLVMSASLVLSGDMYTVLVDTEMVDITASVLVDVALLDISDASLEDIIVVDAVMMDNIDVTRADVILVDATDTAVAVTTGGAVVVVNNVIDDTDIVADVMRLPVRQNNYDKFLNPLQNFYH